MCAARTQTIGTIYTRLSGLLKEGIIKHEDRPLWYDVYKAFPPAREPVYRSVQGGDMVPSMKPPRIIYYEDQIRAQFYKEIEDFDAHNLNNPSEIPTSQKFIEKFYEFVQKNISKDNLFEATFLSLKSQGVPLEYKQDIIKEKREKRKKSE